MTRKQALKLAYPGRDTSGWDANAPDAKVDALLKRCGKKTRTYPRLRKALR